MPRAPEPVVAMWQSKDDHPHQPPGSPQGGQFQPTNKSAPAKAAPAKAAPGKPAAKGPSKPGVKPAPKAAPTGPPPAPVTQTLSRRGKNDPAQVRTLQQLLAALKIGDGSQDGVFGANTEQAVKDLQTKLGVRPTGHASPGLAKRLADAAILSPCVKASAGPEFVAAAALSAADVNDLPDDQFAYIEPGGTKDSEGKTVPRSLRHFPINAAHVRNALARAPQSPFGDKAMPAIRAACKKFGIAWADDVKAAAEPIAASASMPNVELARPGTWHLSSGKRVFEAQDLKDAADFYAASGQSKIPIGFGHTDPRFDGDPAFGWVSNVRYAEDDQGPVLLGDLVEMDDWLAAAAPQRWPNRSIEGFANLDHNGRTYRLALTRLALLGATPPAMPTLKSLSDIKAAINASGAEWFAASALPPSEMDTPDPAPEAVVVPTSPKETGMDPAVFRERLGLDDASDDEVMEALAAAGFVPQPDPSTSDAADRSIAASAAATGGVITIDASQLEEFRASAARADALAKRIEQTDRDNAITAAIQAGKMPPARRAHYERAWDADPQGTRQLINSLAANLVPVMASGYSGDAAEDAQFETEYAALFPPTSRKAG